MTSMEAGLHIQNPSSKPKDLGHSRRKFDNESVDRTYDVLKNWGNPFDPERSILVNICSGAKATPDTSKDLLDEVTTGEECFKSFVADRIVSNKIPFHDPITKLKLKTFGDLIKKKKLNVNSKEITITAERSMFGRLLVIARSRDSLTLRQILTYSLSPIPWSLGLPDGSLVKTPKSTLLGNLNTFSHK